MGKDTLFSLLQRGRRRNHVFPTHERVEFSDLQKGDLTTRRKRGTEWDVVIGSGTVWGPFRSPSLTLVTHRKHGDSSFFVLREPSTLVF